jgi:hypothetical protein
VTEEVVELLKLPAPVAGDRLQVTPLLAGSPVVVAETVTVPPACTWGAGEVTDTTTFGGGGGGGGGALLLLQPGMATVRAKME